MMQKEIIKMFKEILSKTKLKSIIDDELVKLKEDDDLSEAFLKFKLHRISHLVVVNHKNEFVGLISQKYLYRAHAPRKIMNEQMEFRPNILLDGDSYYDRESLDRVILRHIMNKEVFTLKQDDTVMQAIEIMAKNYVGCIPIVDNHKKVFGVVTTHTIIEHLYGLMTS